MIMVRPCVAILLSIICKLILPGTPLFNIHHVTRILYFDWIDFINYSVNDYLIWLLLSHTGLGVVHNFQYLQMYTNSRLESPCSEARI